MPVELPAYARVKRSLAAGEHALLDIIPGLKKSPALKRIAPDPQRRKELVAAARVYVHGSHGYCFVDVEGRRIVVSEKYYQSGDDLDLYLDLLHELTHLRQLDEGFDLWDERFDYVERPTEVEGYAVAVGEGRRLGMSEEEVYQHLSNPWMSKAQVNRLLSAIDVFLTGGPLPNIEAARSGAAFQVWTPWDVSR